MGRGTGARDIGGLGAKTRGGWDIDIRISGTPYREDVESRNVSERGLEFEASRKKEHSSQTVHKTSGI
jgi:hypothetical protein